MKKLLLFLTLTALIASWPRVALAKTLTIAVIDSGVDSSVPNLCKFGHKSFVTALPNPLVDEHGHGTHIAGLISSTAGLGDYCIVSIKYYDPNARGVVNLDHMIKAIQYAINIKVNFINISGGGPEPDPRERKAVQNALNKRITMVVAAGNESHNLDESCNYYPACYDPRLVVVGNLEHVTDYKDVLKDIASMDVESAFKRLNNPGPETERCPSSNYGDKVTRWEIGTNLKSAAPGGGTAFMTGTSQATAVATGKLVRERLHR